MSNLKWEEWTCVSGYLGLSALPNMSCQFPLFSTLGWDSPQFYHVFYGNYEPLSNLGRFTTLWPKNAKLKTKLKTTMANEYSNRAVPSSMKLPKNLYSLKDMGLTWFGHLKERLMKRGFWKSLELNLAWLFLRGSVILLVYINDICHE
jgi:hypothetical protein